ncbi:hypothetical protein B0J14DRAFT_258185 [Halenospora varia]|nr:hypothetical protein B0J14DRAFT_258185 [Halenospora varia]
MLLSSASSLWARSRRSSGRATSPTRPHQHPIPGLHDFHLKHKVTYSFCAQLFQNLDEQPVDDIGVAWDENRYPFEQIANIEFEPQDSWLPEFCVWWDNRITVNSWHGLKVHQPLGNTNRMRRVVYAESRKLRLRVNGFKDSIEPRASRRCWLRSSCRNFRCHTIQQWEAWRWVFSWRVVL